MTWRDTVASLDWVLTGASFLLVAIGMAMLISAGSDQQLFSGLALRQLAAWGVGLAVFTIIVRIPYHMWKRWAPIVYGIGVGSLVIVTTIGQVIRGTVSRFEFFGWQLQPSEFMKVALVVMLAWTLARSRRIQASAVFVSLALVTVPVALVLAEPDAGMAGLMLVLWLGVLVFSGLPLKHIVLVALVGSILGVASWNWFLLPYQKERIVTFVNPQADPLAAGYNVTQSIIAFGSGQFFGRGLGHGPQSQLKFLPERHTDFILASLGEELGFVGVALVMGLYATMLWRIVLVAQATRDPFGQLLCVGTFFVLLTSFMVSAGMNIGLLPVTGIPLPLLSYGGSNLLATFILLGLVQSVQVNSHFLRVQTTEISGIM